jgi:hypothetical protein
MYRWRIDARQASIDTESEMVSLHGRAESYATVAAPGGWHAPQGWASVSANRSKDRPFQGENCEIQV